MSAITEAIKRIAEKLIIQGKDGEYKKGVRRGFFISIGVLKEESEREKDLSYKMKCEKRDMEKKISVLEGTISRQSKTIKSLERSLLSKTKGGDQ